ncbi:hypothetical protein, partial [Kibdelosporangium persicum]
MRRPRVRSRRLVYGVTSVAMITGLLVPQAAHAEPVAPAVPAIPVIADDPAATAMPESTEVEKVRAVRAIEVGEATDEWLMLSDKNFVF